MAKLCVQTLLFKSVMDKQTDAHAQPFYGPLGFCPEHTQTHSRFTALLEFVRDYLGEQVPER